MCYILKRDSPVLGCSVFFFLLSFSSNNIFIFLCFLSVYFSV